MLNTVEEVRGFVNTLSAMNDFRITTRQSLSDPNEVELHTQYDCTSFHLPTTTEAVEVEVVELEESSAQLEEDIAYNG